MGEHKALAPNLVVLPQNAASVRDRQHPLTERLHPEGIAWKRPLHLGRRRGCSSAALLPTFCASSPCEYIHQGTVRESDVNRGTFYAHYASVHDLLMQMKTKCLPRSTRRFLALPADGERSPSTAHLHGTFSVPEGQRRPLHRDARTFGDKSFAMRMLNMGWEKCFDAYYRYFRDASPKQIAYFYAFVSEGCIGFAALAARGHDHQRRGHRRPG